MGSKSTTLDTRVVDWLGHSGASLRGAVLEEILILSLSSGRVVSTEVSLCSGVPQAVVSLNDWIFRAVDGSGAPGNNPECVANAVLALASLDSETCQ